MENIKIRLLKDDIEDYKLLEKCYQKCEFKIIREFKEKDTIRSEQLYVLMIKE